MTQTEEEKQEKKARERLFTIEALLFLIFMQGCIRCNREGDAKWFWNSESEKDTKKEIVSPKK